MVVTNVQTSIVGGQLRPTNQMVYFQDYTRAAALTVKSEALYDNGLERVLPGRKCIVNACTSNQEPIVTAELGTREFLYYHMIDAVGIVHVLILRIESRIVPVENLVFSGHYEIEGYYFNLWPQEREVKIHEPIWHDLQTIHKFLIQTRSKKRFQTP